MSEVDIEHLDPGDLPPISYVWQTPIKRPRRAKGGGSAQHSRAHAAHAVRKKLERITSRAPEVMVKVTGRTKDLDHLRSHLEYITRNGELPAETDQGALLVGRQGLRDLQARWSDDVALDNKRRANGTLSVNIILSMPPGTDQIRVRDAVRAFAVDTFEGKHDYAFVLHEDDPHPHVHLTVRALGYHGKRLNVRKADLHSWRECFARELRLRGIEAEATPRRTRGKVRKAERGKIRAMKGRGAMPRIERLAREEIVKEAQGGLAADRPWDAKILARQKAIRAHYLEYAADLRRSDDPQDVALGRKIEEFVREMPAPETQRHELRRQLAAHISNLCEQREKALESPGRETAASRDRSR